MTAQQSLKNRQDIVNISENNPRTKNLIYSKNFFKMIRLIETEINLIQAQQIIIVDLKYTLYTKEQFKERIKKIEQINFIIAYNFIYYDIIIKKKIKNHHCKHIKIIKGTI